MKSQKEAQTEREKRDIFEQESPKNHNSNEKIPKLSLVKEPRFGMAPGAGAAAEQISRIQRKISEEVGHSADMKEKLPNSGRTVSSKKIDWFRQSFSHN